jgi:Ferritin-like domain
MSAETELAELLTAVDVDGALQETAAAAFPATRRGFLRTAAAAGLGALGLGAFAPRALAAWQPRDIAILRFDLALEYLQAALYTEAERIGAIEPTTLAWARVVGAHERAHARAIKGLLGPLALPSPSFDFHGVTEREQPFIKTAVAFEELTAGVLKWQAVRLDSRDIVAAVATLHSVETRHAAWIRHIIGLPPAASAFDHPAAQAKMARLIASTKFVTRRPRTSGAAAPKFTG